MPNFFKVQGRIIKLESLGISDTRKVKQYGETALPQPRTANKDGDVEK